MVCSYVFAISDTKWKTNCVYFHFKSYLHVLIFSVIQRNKITYIQFDFISNFKQLKS